MRERTTYDKVFKRVVSVTGIVCEHKKERDDE